MSESVARASCSACGLPLPGGELAGRCPRCLLTLALSQVPEGADGSEPAPDPSRPARRYFGDFELLEKIAEGGMGVVWKARQITVPRVVALKMIHEGHLASTDARVRFGAEIEATARLDHPNIVPLLETGQQEGVHFFTMKLIASGDLATRRGDIGIAGLGLSTNASGWRSRQRHLARLLVKIARAVHYAHLRGILHRDLKPSNVLIDEAGEPYVADFGLAKMLTREHGVTFANSVLGSPNYMAPEQAAGRTRELTTATDVYGLGAIFYELLVGRPPFQAESPIATLQQVIEKAPEPPRSLHPPVDSDLETICLRCLEKSPAARYASAEAFAEDLERWLARRPILARRATALEHAWRWCLREPALAVAVAVCFALLLSVAIGSTLAAIRIGRAERAAIAALSEAQISQARNLRLASEIGHREEGLKLLRAATRPGLSEASRQRARDELLATLVRTDFEFLPMPGLHPARDPRMNLVAQQFNRLASLIESNTVVVRRVTDGSEVNRFQIGDAKGARLEQFSHAGRFLGLRRVEGIEIWDVETGGKVWATNVIGRAFGFAPDRDEFVFEEFDQQATILRLPTLEFVQRVGFGAEAPQERGQSCSAIALSPEGRTLVVASRRHRTMAWIDLANGRSFRLSTNRAVVVSMAWSADGSRLAAALGNGRVPVFNRRGAPLFDLPGFPTVAQTLAFNAEGSLLAVQGMDRILRLVDTEAVRHAFEAPCDSGGITFDPEGERFGPVFRGEEFGSFRLRKPSEFRQANIASTRIEFDEVKFSRDARWVAVGNLTNVVFCDAVDGRRLLSRPGWRITACALDPADDFVYAANITGMFRWRSHLDDQNRLGLSEMELVFKGRGWRSFGFSPDGSRFVAANIHSNAAFVFDRSLTNILATLGPQAADDAVAISPDNRWVTTGSSKDRQVRVWDALSVELVRSIPAGEKPRASFSADGKWLATSGDAFTLLDVRSWELAPPLPLPENRPIPGAAAFSPDGQVLAIVWNFSLIQLVNLRNFRSLGELQSPGKIALHAIQFSPDGSLLAGTGAVGRLQIWDMRQIRARLREFALDWDWP